LRLTKSKCKDKQWKERKQIWHYRKRRRRKRRRKLRKARINNKKITK